MILEIGLRLGGFVLSSIQERRNEASAAKKGAYRIMCLGESTTAGQYPAFLGEELNRRSAGMKFSVIDKGIAGTNTSHTVGRLEADLEAYHPNMVITMMGINDEGPHMPKESIPSSNYSDMAVTMMGINDKEPHIPKEKISYSNISNFLRSCRVYKLMRLLQLHIAYKLKGRRSDQLKPVSSGLQDPREVNRQKIDAYYKLARPYLSQGKGPEAEELFQKIIAANPRDDMAYYVLGWVYLNQDKSLAAMSAYQKAVDLNPQNCWIFDELGVLCKERGQMDKAEKIFTLAANLNPKDDWVYNALGWIYLNQGKVVEAEEAYKKAVVLNPQDVELYYALGWLYQKQGRIAEVESLYQRAIKDNPEEDWAYSELGTFYMGQGKLTEAEKLFKKAVELSPENDRIAGNMILLYEKMGNTRLAEEYRKRAESLGLNHFPAHTAANYRSLRATLAKKGIVYVCMQYPMRNIDPLKKIFQGQTEGIIFIDNEKMFKDALKQGSYSDYFKDIFGGDFGHCTDKGNKLIARNLSDIILKDGFNK
ncbi:MAG: tetratricopeptide repeat protein [Candidatus Omnitrophota bacterium]